MPEQLLMTKPLGVHAREETVVVAVKVVEVEVVVIQYKRNLPSRSLGWSSSFRVLSKSKSLALSSSSPSVRADILLRSTRVSWPTAESITNDLLFLPHAAAELLDT